MDVELHGARMDTTGRQTYRQAERQTDRQSNGQITRETTSG